MARNLIVCLDGTGNHPDDASEPGNYTTNVFRLSEALLKDAQQGVKYFPGVGTTGWGLIDLKGTITGFGAGATDLTIALRTWPNWVIDSQWFIDTDLDHTTNTENDTILPPIATRTGRQLEHETDHCHYPTESA